MRNVWKTLRRGAALLLGVCVLAGLLAGCGKEEESKTQEDTAMQQTEQTTQTEPNTEQTAPETPAPAEVPAEPELETVTRELVAADGSVHLYYDDRIRADDIAGGSVSSCEVTDQQPTSRAVGSDAPDEAVLYHDTGANILVAVGTGTATLVIDGTAHAVTVEPAPISLVMIAGHSLGEGSQGEAGQQTVCQSGQAYSTHKVLKLADETAPAGLGFGAANRPADIDAFSMSGRGTPGEAGALANRWNQLTGEKIWVVNAAVGGSCLNEWVQGTEYHDGAVALYTKAAAILQAEAAAGHYAVRNTAVIYHSAVNFEFKNVTFDNALLEQWYDSLWSGFRTELAADFDGDGTAEAPQALGFVPFWNVATAHAELLLDRPANFYMAASDAYPDMFLASMIVQRWLTPEDLRANFPEIDYETHGFAVEKPTSADTLFADGVHLRQPGYNALGADIGENLFRHFRQPPQARSVKLLSPSGTEIGDTIELTRRNVEYAIAILPEPACVSDLTITVEGDLELAYPMLLRDTGSGGGTLTISQGDTVLRTVTVTVPAE